MVLAGFAHEADAFEHVGDVVDAALLNFEASHCLVELERLGRRLLQHQDELVRQGHQAVLAPAPLPQLRLPTR